MRVTTPTVDVSEIYQTRYMGFVSFTVLIWDHIITFDDEVEFVWKGSKGPLVYLFFLNRYLIPVGFIVNLVAYSLQSWPIETCSHYVRYEGSMTVIGIEVVGLMMLLRVYALYKRQSRVVIGIVAFILLVETGMNIWLLMHSMAVQHPSGMRSCSMIFDPNISDAASASAWLPLLYDTIVLFLILYRTVPSIRHQQAGHVVQTIFEDGLLYYSVICSVTLVLTIMIVAAEPGIKNITAQLELLLTVAMMSRITLNLRKEAHISAASGDNATFDVKFSRDRSFSDATTRTRSHSYTDYITGGADTGVNFAVPVPARRLSTIKSEISLGSETRLPETSASSAAEHGDIGEMLWNSALVAEEPEKSWDSNEVMDIRAGGSRDEESL
jgi:hypothetical protein